MEPTYCVVAECEEPADGHGDKCAMHARRWNRGDRGAELSRPKEEDLTAEEKIIRAANALLDSFPDAIRRTHHQLETDLGKAEHLALKLAECDDDNEYNRLRRALKLACKALGESTRRAERAERIKAGLAEARKRGVRPGPSRKLEPSEALERLARARGSISEASRLSPKVSRATLRKALMQSDTAHSS